MSILFNIEIGIEMERKQIEWIKQQDIKVAQYQRRPYPHYGCSGGGYSYIITPTMIGTIINFRNNITQESIDLTNYDEW